MLERQCLAAFTEIAYFYPSYISVNYEIDGTIIVTARERGSNGTKVVNLPVVKKDLLKFVTELKEKLEKLPD